MESDKEPVLLATILISMVTVYRMTLSVKPKHQIDLTYLHTED